jgi:MFS family permease
MARLWRQADFALLWSAQTISVFGSQISTLALPLTAILVLKATPAQMGLMLAIGAVPTAVFGPVAGAWVDRLPRRPVMIAADLGRAALLCLVPVGAWLGILQIEALYFLAFVTGTLRLCFDVAYQSFLPALVERGRLVEANSALEASQSISQVAGPGLAGALVGLLTAPVAVLIDALSFIGSALCLGAIRVQESVVPSGEERGSIWREAAEGARVVWRDPVLRALTVSSGLFNLFDGVLFAVYLLYLTHTLHVAATLVGSVFAIGGLGGLAGAVLAGPTTKKLGLGPALLGGLALAAAGELCIGLATGPLWSALLMVATAEAAVEMGATIFGINAVSLRQAVTPDHLLGRVNATVRCIGLAGLPLGGILGGALGQWYGLRAAALIAGAGTFTALVAVLCSPVRDLRRTE